MYITGIGMPSAFDTIIREELVKILEKIVGDDEVRMCKLLFNTTLDVKMQGVQTEKFETTLAHLKVTV